MASVVAIVVVQGSLTVVGVLVGDAASGQPRSYHRDRRTATARSRLRLLQIRALPVGNLLPALLLAPVLVFVVSALR